MLYTSATPPKMNIEISLGTKEIKKHPLTECFTNKLINQSTIQLPPPLLSPQVSFVSSFLQYQLLK
jgi:hypothetical protein